MISFNIKRPETANRNDDDLAQETRGYDINDDDLVQETWGYDINDDNLVQEETRSDSDPRDDDEDVDEDDFMDD